MTAVARLSAAREGGIVWPHLACAAFIVLWLNIGVANTVMTAIPTVIKVGVLGLWLVVAAARSWPFFNDFAVGSWPLLAMLLVGVLYFAEIEQSVQYVQGMGYLLIAFAFFAFYSADHLARERKVLVTVLLADMAVIGVNTTIALQGDPRLARYLATTEDKRTEVYGNQSFAGLGGYGFAYSLAAVLVVLMYFVVRHERRALLALVILVGLGVIVELSFATAIVLSFGLGAVFFIRDVVRETAARLLIYGGLALGWLVGFYSALLRFVASQSVVSDDVRQRLVELAELLAGRSEAGSDLGTRITLWLESLSLFLSSGPFGLAGRSASNQSTGDHSQWFDLLAAYGVWALFLAAFFVLAWRLTRRRLDPTELAGVRRAWILFGVLGTVGTLLFCNIVLTWMFLVPSLVQWLAQRTRARTTQPRIEVPA